MSETTQAAKTDEETHARIQVRDWVRDTFFRRAAGWGTTGPSNQVPDLEHPDPHYNQDQDILVKLCFDANQAEVEASCLQAAKTAGLPVTS